MPSRLWNYDPRTHNYRNNRTGRFIGLQARLDLRDEWTNAQNAITDMLADDYFNGRVKRSEFLDAMREEIKINYIEQYMLGRGGRNAMTQADWGRVGRAIRNQYDFLQGFADEITNLSLAQIQARSRLYMESGTSAYEIGSAASRGIVLPEYPADGNQNCVSNCRCNWKIEEDGSRWLCTWELDPAAKHCQSCLDNAGKWNPLVVLKV